ncbi:MAG TPA: DUF3822 family protein [Bacteroidales bacterium]|nr:DUF3822 family protein [Bacteroidales bacterium]
MFIAARPTLSRFDKAFREDHTRQYHLTIRIGADGFSYVIFSNEKQRYLALESWAFIHTDTDIRISSAIDETIIQKPWLAYPFQSVLVLVDQTYNTLVPAALYDEKEKAVYLGFMQQYRENSRVAADELKTAGAWNVYYLANSLVHKIKEIWANARIVHLTSALVESLLVAKRNQPGETEVYVNLRSSSFDLVVIAADKLLFYNNFKARNPEDFLYFLLFALDQQSLNPETVSLTLMGNITIDHPIYESIWKYVRNVRFAAPNNAFEYSYVLEDIQTHQHHLLFSALQCAL